MDYQINEQKTYPHSIETVGKAMGGAIEGLGGKILDHDAERGFYKVWFNKTILGRVLGDRSQFEMTLTEEGGSTQVSMMAIPVDPVGREMKFGVRKGALPTAVAWFWAHIEHRLPKE